jgi:LysM repeat protein
MSRRWLFYLALNVVVSAATVLLVLYLVGRGQPQAMARPTFTPLPPTQTPTLFVAPTATLQSYQIRQGDTLGAVAAMFGVSSESLAQFNRLADPNSLDVGQVLLIPARPAGSVPTPQAPTITPAPGEAFPWPRIEMVYSLGDAEKETVKIVNPGPTVQLDGWRLRGASGREFVFPAVELIAGGAMLVHTAPGVDTPVDVYWGLSASAWQHGEELHLLDAQGQVRSAVVLP